MPYHLTRSGEGYYVVSPHGHHLSSKPLSHEQAVRQETAVRLTELRAHNPHYASKDIMGTKEEEHVHTKHAVHHEHQKEHKMDAEGLLFVPVSRELVHPKQTIPTSDIFAPLPMPTHHLRKTQHYASHQ